MSHQFSEDEMTAATQLSNARALAAGQAAWDNACPPEDDEELVREREAEWLRDRFTEAMAGDMAAPARFAWPVPYLGKKNATAADVLADALADNPDLMRRAMAVVAEAARYGDVDAQEVIEQAAREWSEQHA